ncbi:hypothetical protein [Azospirillum brasilense]|uniref:Uncharacterized protein n=1 Tax=Azospirillum brasilense TaxID=192 RepID=A0A6L3AT05_AZOBR|nr:hypothetical protein [Azospirillum brasilense]KAA0678187.1 hypothetical protein DS837_28120 [Azospirillum brasilense]
MYVTCYDTEENYPVHRVHSFRQADAETYRVVLDNGQEINVALASMARAFGARVPAPPGTHLVEMPAEPCETFDLGLGKDPMFAIIDFDGQFFVQTYVDPMLTWPNAIQSVIVLPDGSVMQWGFRSADTYQDWETQARKLFSQRKEALAAPTGSC